jgi:hypothetical protein
MTTDHAEEARFHLESAAKLALEDGAQVEATMAVAHATLALAAEQRTANLIAQRGYVRDFLLDTRILSPGPKRDAMIPLLADETAVLGDRIREALDLQPLHRVKLDGTTASVGDDGLVP